VRVDPAADVTDAVLTGVGQEEVPFTVERSGDGVELRAHVPPGVPVTDELTGERHPPTWTAVAGSGQARRPLTVLDHTVGHRPDAASSLYLRAGVDRGLTVVDVPHFVELDRIDTSDDQLRLSGTVVGDPATFSLVLASAHLDVPVTVGSVVDGRFEATAPLRVSVWGGPELPLPRGIYVLEGRVGTDPFSTFVTPELVGRLPVVDSRPHLRMRFELARRDGLRMRITRPRLPNEYGAYNQTKLLERFAQDDLPPLDAVYFESFFGRNATCNPRAMDREIARRRPDLPRYWAVDDYSVQVPPGGIPLVIGSEDWWRVRESARWIVTNEWFRTRYVKKPYQTVLQTWHGSMYKKIGLDRTKKGKAHLARVRLERSSWDLFLSQNGDTTPIIRRAYDFTGGVVESGYPRNDELHDPDPERIQAVRDALGINPGDTVVMYAPTWRELNQEDVELLNVVDVSERLGPGFTFLQRGHVRTLDLSQVVRHDNVIDVSTYPQINDLYLAADVLITDYSSMMFDFSVTRRPMIFYTPDIEEYTDPRVRGVYFDLEEVAAGPVVKTPEEVVNLLATLDTWVPTYADRYAAWTERFNHADDGHVSERAVDALFAFDPHQRSSVPQRNVPLPAGAGEDA
jgi:CDP-glycerol glycerophosphotransferase (TagB/SpsB family)